MAARVRVHDGDAIVWRNMRDVVPADKQHMLAEGELGSRQAVHEWGSADSLQLFEVEFQPYAMVDVHAHDSEEIIYVVDGAIRLGKKLVGKGSSIFVTGNTLYSFAAGPEGLRILNFRPHKDESYITPEVFRTRRKNL